MTQTCWSLCECEFAFVLVLVFIYLCKLMVKAPLFIDANNVLNVGLSN